MFFIIIVSSSLFASEVDDDVVVAVIVLGPHFGYQCTVTVCFLYYSAQFALCVSCFIVASNF